MYKTTVSSFQKCHYYLGRLTVTNLFFNKLTFRLKVTCCKNKVLEMSQLVDPHDIDMMIVESAGDIDNIPIPADNDSSMRGLLEGQLAQLGK